MFRTGNRESSSTRTAAGAGRNGPALEKGKRRLQRIVREPSTTIRDVAFETDLQEAVVVPEQKAAKLSPELAMPAAAKSSEGVQYQCTECDMMVRDSDPYCPYCGAIFADGPLGADEEAAEASETPERSEPEEPEESVRPGRFDIYSVMKTGSRARDLLYQEAMKGFAGSARLLEEIEHLISDISSLGADTTRARRLMGNAWEACREGNWHLVSALARQTEEVVAPNISSLVRSELAKARELLMDAKASGADVSDYVLKMKAAMHCLKSGDDDEALRLTKELMDLLRADSVSWGDGVSPASRNSFRSSH
jgi:uncharacterized Zn finger protein (UPF0148 family)